MNDAQIIHELYRRKRNFEPYSAYCTTTKPLILRVWQKRHPVEENTIEREIAPGTTLKIVMVSRLGDFGVTDDLDAKHGYHLRLPLDTDMVTDFRWEP